MLLILRLALAMGLVRLAFRWEGGRMFLRMTGLLFVVSLLFAGGMAALWSLLSPRGLAVRNGTVYFHIPAWMLAGAATVGYLAARGMGAALEKRLPEKLVEGYTVQALGRAGNPPPAHRYRQPPYLFRPPGGGHRGKSRRFPAAGSGGRRGGLKPCGSGGAGLPREAEIHPLPDGGGGKAAARV